MRLHVALLLVACTMIPTHAEPLAKRVWQLHDYDLSHIRRLIRMAAEQGINEIQLSHDIVMDAHQVLENPKLARDISTICEDAHARGIKVSIWTHELQAVPEEFRNADRRVNGDDPRLWTWLTDKYTRLFDTCPQIDGLVLTFHETQVSIYHDTKVSSTLPPAQRVARLIDTLAGVCKARGKELTVRSFCYEPHELQFIKEGFAAAKSDFIVMSKCQPHDWQPYYPNNPLIGDVGGRPQIMEFDLGHEFLGQGDIPYIDVDYTKRRLDYGVSKGIIGAVARIERHKNHALDTPNWANVYVFSRLLQNHGLDAQQLLESYLAERYGKSVASDLARILNRTFEIVNKSFFALGFWATDHSRIPSYGYALSHLDWVGTDKWDPDPKWKATKKRLMSPDASLIRDVRREKTEAVLLCRRSLAELEMVRPMLSRSDYAELAAYLKREEAVALTWREYFDVFFNLRAYETSGDPLYKTRTEMAIQKLLECARGYGDELRAVSGDGGADNVTRIESFVRECRKKLESPVKTTSQ